MGALAMPLAIIGAATQAVGTIMAGREQAAAARFEAEQMRRQEQETRIAADQAEARRRQELAANLETIGAIRAGRGVSSRSPTALSIVGSIVEDEESNVRSERLNYLSRAEQYRLGAKMQDRKARMSLVSSYIGAVGGLASAGQKFINSRRDA